MINDKVKGLSRKSLKGGCTGKHVTKQKPEKSSEKYHFDENQICRRQILQL